MKIAGSIGLALALALAGLASACGPSTPDVQNPPAPTGEPTATAAPTASDAPTAAPTASAAPTTTAEPTAPPGPAGPAVKASAFAEKLKNAGFDLAKLPPKIDKMTDGQKKKIMPLFVEALGYKDCTGCHVEGDFKKKTRHLEIAEHMYDEFVAKLRDEKGNATVFCDSCHDGKSEFLNRSDRAAVNKYMDVEYVGHFTRADKTNQECSSCHTDTFEMKIFDKVWKVPAH